MIPLTHTIESEVELNGVTYPLDLSFNNVLTVFDVLGDEDLTPTQSLDTALFLLIGEGFELTLNEKVALLKAVFQEHIGQQTTFVEKDVLGNPLPTKEEDPTYSFQHDADYIYAAFMQAYRIDLIGEQGKMSWSQFKALFAGLPEETAFRRIVSIRTRELPTGKGSEKERSELAKLKRIYGLPGNGGDEE